MNKKEILELIERCAESGEELPILPEEAYRDRDIALAIVSNHLNVPSADLLPYVVFKDDREFLELCVAYGYVSIRTLKEINIDCDEWLMFLECIRNGDDSLHYVDEATFNSPLARLNYVHTRKSTIDRKILEGLTNPYHIGAYTSIIQKQEKAERSVSYDVKDLFEQIISSRVTWDVDFFSEFMDSKVVAIAFLGGGHGAIADEVYKRLSPRLKRDPEIVAEYFRHRGVFGIKTAYEMYPGEMKDLGEELCAKYGVTEEYSINAGDYIDFNEEESIGEARDEMVDKEEKEEVSFDELKPQIIRLIQMCAESGDVLPELPDAAYYDIDIALAIVKSGKRLHHNIPKDKMPHKIFSSDLELLKYAVAYGFISLRAGDLEDNPYSDSEELKFLEAVSSKTHKNIWFPDAKFDSLLARLNYVAARKGHVDVDPKLTPTDFISTALVSIRKEQEKQEKNISDDVKKVYDEVFSRRKVTAAGVDIDLSDYAEFFPELMDSEVYAIAFLRGSSYGAEVFKYLSPRLKRNPDVVAEYLRHRSPYGPDYGLDHEMYRGEFEDLGTEICAQYGLGVISDATTLLDESEELTDENSNSTGGMHI